MSIQSPAGGAIFNGALARVPKLAICATGFFMKSIRPAATARRAADILNTFASRGSVAEMAVN